jgi:hypothetical protein
MKNNWKNGLAAIVLALAGCTQAPRADEAITRSAPTMTGWTYLVGDGIYNVPGEEPVSIGDIRTRHTDSLTTLEANILGRNIMAHNITHLWYHGNHFYDKTQVFETGVRLPYIPIADERSPVNAETIEAQLGYWSSTHSLDAVCAVQWQINPWTEDFGALALWTPGRDEAGEWQIVDALPVDTRWQRWRLEIDPVNRVCTYLVDGISYVETTPLDPKDWISPDGVHVAVEIISIYPGDSGTGGRPHYAEFKEWTWTIGTE